MKKIIAIAMTLILVCCCAAFAESAETAPFEPVAGVTVQIPVNLTRIEGTNYTYAFYDGTTQLAIQVTTDHAYTEMTAQFQSMKDAGNIATLETAEINGREFTFADSGESAYPGALACTELDDGTVLTFVVYGNSDMAENVAVARAAAESMTIA